MRRARLSRFKGFPFLAWKMRQVRLCQDASAEPVSFERIRELFTTGMGARLRRVFGSITVLFHTARPRSIPCHRNRR